MITEQLLRIIPGWSPLTDLQPAQLAARGAKEGKSEKPGAITALECAVVKLILIAFKDVNLN